jgi:division protein CdvB (Snf7/Vps24/ESCRT-III family)
MKTRTIAIETMARAMVQSGSPWVASEPDSKEWLDWVEEARAALAALEAGGYEIVTRGAIEAAIREEREACAKVAEDEAASRVPRDLDNDSHWGPVYRDRIARAIRARP